jgi:hypothetical protein
MLSNKGFKSIFIKLLVYFYTMIQLPINRILMGLITYFIFEAQIKYMWFLINFKVSEILRVIIFYTICSPSFPYNCLHHTIHLPQKRKDMLIEFLIMKIGLLIHGLFPIVLSLNDVTSDNPCFWEYGRHDGELWYMSIKECIDSLGNPKFLVLNIVII